MSNVVAELLRKFYIQSYVDLPDGLVQCKLCGTKETYDTYQNTVPLVHHEGCAVGEFERLMEAKL